MCHDTFYRYTCGCKHELARTAKCEHRRLCDRLHDGQDPQYHDRYRETGEQCLASYGKPVYEDVRSQCRLCVRKEAFGNSEQGRDKRRREEDEDSRVDEEVRALRAEEEKCRRVEREEAQRVWDALPPEDPSWEAFKLKWLRRRRQI